MDVVLAAVRCEFDAVNAIDDVFATEIFDARVVVEAMDSSVLNSVPSIPFKISLSICAYPSNDEEASHTEIPPKFGSDMIDLSESRTVSEEAKLLESAESSEPGKPTKILFFLFGELELTYVDHFSKLNC